MQKKWGYIAGAVTVCASLATLIAAFTSSYSISNILAVVTTLACVTAVVVFHFAYAKSEQKLATEQKILVRRHTESLAHAIQRQVAPSEEARVNAESAESAAAEKIAETHRDDESGLLSSSFFPVYLEQRITAARRTLRPVSLVIFELDGLDKNDSRAPSDRNFYISAVGDVVKRTLRESDCAFRIDNNTFAAVMDDTAESGAVWAAERVRGVLHTGALAGRVTVSAGVACYPSHALEPEDLIESATKALDVARSRGVDQVEIAAES